MNISEIQALFIPHINCGGVLFGPEKSSPLCKQKKDTKKGWHKGVSNEGGSVSDSDKIVCLETVHSRKGTAVRVVWGRPCVQDLRCVVANRL